MTDEDDLDPSAWLAAQFSEEAPKPAPAVAPTPPAAAPPFTAPPFSAPPLVAPSNVPEAPPQQWRPAAQPPWSPAGQEPAVPGPVAAPPAAAPITPPAFTPPPAAAPVAPAAAPVSPQPGAAGGGFQWGLTPGAEPTAPTPPAQTPVAPAAPTFPVEPPAWPAAQSPTNDPAPAGQPTPASPPLNQPTVGFPAFGQPDGFAGQPDEFAGQSVEPVAPSPAQWLAAPLDPALEGVTEVFEAELVGLPGAQGENVGASSIDDIFGDAQFRDFSGEPLITPLSPRQAGGSGGRADGTPKSPRGPRAPIPRNQKILMLVAGVLVAALALVALYAVGMKVASLAPAPAIVPSATPSATASPAVLPVGPVKPGSYHWDQLLGGECLTGFTSAWEDKYTVVDCATAHPAQLVFRGTFTDPASATYPGIAELQKRTNLLCTPATIINYGVAGTVLDIQVQASYAADEADWDKGSHDYFCFVNRSGGGDLSASVAIPQVAVTPTPAAAPVPSSTPGAPVARGHAQGTKPAKP